MTVIICEPRYINDYMNALAETYGITILHACESGSRAWGFESPDSDYDVRFIYTQPLSRYLCLEKPHDSIAEFSSDRVMDFHGWDIRKALGLLVKGNASFVEWMNSPIIYQQDWIFADAVANMMPRELDLGSCFAHYRSMAKKHYLEHVKDRETVNSKKFLYVLRPLLAAQWIHQYGTFPPVAFRELIGSMFDQNNSTRVEIEKLISLKMTQNEQGDVPAAEYLTVFIQEEIVRQESIKFPSVEISTRDVNKLLRDTILRFDRGH